MNQNNVACLLGLALILMLLCQQQNKNIFELFGISSLSSGNINNGGGNSNINKEIQIIFVYAEWCGHCNTFKPEWAKFEGWAKQNGIKAEKIEGDKNQPLCAKHQIQGFPTILKLDSSGNKVAEYNGARSSEGLIEFI